MGHEIEFTYLKKWPVLGRNKNIQWFWTVKMSIWWVLQCQQFTRAFFFFLSFFIFHRSRRSRFESFLKVFNIFLQNSFVFLQILLSKSSSNFWARTFFMFYRVLLRGGLCWKLCHYTVFLYKKRDCAFLVYSEIVDVPGEVGRLISCAQVPEARKIGP
jgi:hypothetical protein